MRFTQSVFIDYTAEGIPLNAEFARSAIRVAWRFAYEDVLATDRRPAHAAKAAMSRSQSAS